MGDDLDRRTRRRATTAVVLLAAGIVVAVAAPIVGGDEFLPLRMAKGHWVSVTTTGAGSRWTWVDATGFTDPARVRVPWRALFAPADFIGLVASDRGWLAATVALVALPLWFLWWRRSAMSFARGIGVLASAGATAALVALAWPAPWFCAAHVLIAAPVAYLAAFLVAPEPRVLDAE